jgi:hypothetical protein
MQFLLIGNLLKGLKQLLLLLHKVIGLPLKDFERGICELHAKPFIFAIYECLDWQNSQFINIVGKDDNSAAIDVK